MNIQNMSLIILLSLFNCILVYPQNESADTISNDGIVRGLVFKHKTRTAVKYVREGKKVAYLLKDSRQIRRGVLEKVKPNSMIVSGNEIPFYAIQEFKAKPDAIISGEEFAGLSILTFTGFVIAFTAYLGNDPDVVLNGDDFAILGPIIAAGLVSGFTLLAIKRRFDLNKWEMIAVEKSK